MNPFSAIALNPVRGDIFIGSVAVADRPNSPPQSQRVGIGAGNWETFRLNNISINMPPLTGFGTALRLVDVDSFL